MNAATRIEEQRRKQESEKMQRLRALRLAQPAPAPQPKQPRIRAATLWMNDVRECIVLLCRQIKSPLFTLSDLSAYYEDRLRELHPTNRDPMAFVRHTLQMMRNRGELIFVNDNGLYVYIPLEGKL